MNYDDVSRIVRAIIGGAIIIALAVLINGGVFGSGAPEVGGAAAFANSGQGDELEFRPPSEDDHTFGSMNAEVTIIEYSDIECPFCARFHPTLEGLVDDNENVNWVYRHLPLTSIHSKARDAAIASECVADLAGNEVFWEYLGALFENQKDLSDTLYEDLAEVYGIGSRDFDRCMNDKDIAAEIDQDMKEAVALGARGTPFSVLVAPNGDMIPFSGALPVEKIEELIEVALQE